MFIWMHYGAYGAAMFRKEIGYRETDCLLNVRRQGEISRSVCFGKLLALYERPIRPALFELRVVLEFKSLPFHFFADLLGFYLVRKPNERALMCESFIVIAPEEFIKKHI